MPGKTLLKCSQFKILTLFNRIKCVTSAFLLWIDGTWDCIRRATLDLRIDVIQLIVANIKQLGRAPGTLATCKGVGGRTL